MASVFITNLTLYTGTDFAQTFVLEDTSTNSTLDLTGYTGKSQLKRYEGSTKAADFTVSLANDPKTGRLTIEMLSTVTSTLKPGKYYYDLVLKKPSGTVERALEGHILVKKPVTKL
tara:strand:+ start:2780 stop:3127 length:348 start_codon:yes stop_codon:yes gene_type:complete